MTTVTTMVDENDVFDEVCRIAREELGMTQPLAPEAELLRDLHLDSIGITTLVVGLEDKFRVQLADEDALHVRTVADLVRLVAERAAR